MDSALNSCRRMNVDSDSTDSERDEPKEKKPHCQRTARRCVRKGKPVPLKTGLTEKTSSCTIAGNAAVYSNRVQNCWKNLETSLKQVVKEKDIDSDVEDEHVFVKDTKVTEKESNGFEESPVNYEEELQCIGMDEAPDVQVIGDHDRSLGMPSPPPPPEEVLIENKKSRKGISHKTRKALKNLENAKALLKDTVEAEHHFVDCLDLTSPIRDDITLKINCRGDMLRLQTKKSETFSSITQKIAKMKNAEGKQIKFFRNEESENSISDYDTPATLNLTVADILSCHIISKHSIPDPMNTLQKKNTTGGFKLFVQSRNSRENKVEIEIEQSHHLQELMFKYASLKQSDISKFRFIFDGDDLSPLETPEDLAMESGDTIDAIELTAIEIH